MFLALPIGDNNPRERRPYVNWTLLALNILVFLFVGFRPDAEFKDIVDRYSFVPGQWTPVTLLSSLFLHADLWHLAGNMLFLWIFGDNVEDVLGHVGYSVFYLGCGLSGSLVQTAAAPAALIGASGAISGVIGAYIVFFPHTRVKLLVWFLFFIQIFLVPAWWWIGFWILEQVLLAEAGVQGVAWFAHLGGVAVGAGVAGVARAWFRVHRPHARFREETWESTGVEPSRREAFADAGSDEIEFLEEGPDRYAVVRTVDDAGGAEVISATASALTGEAPEESLRRLRATRGMIARDLPREAADRLCRELGDYGVALIHQSRANEPPSPVPVDTVTWNDSLLRFRVEEGVESVPWSAPFLFTAAEVAGAPRIDVISGRRRAYRLHGATRYTRVDAARRSEEDVDASAFAAAAMGRLVSATGNEGLRRAAEGAPWMTFDAEQDYADHLFWLYNLARTRGGP